MAMQNLLLFLMIVGKSLGAADRWKGNRVEDTGSFISLRQSPITYNCASAGFKGCMSCSSYPYCPTVGATAYNITCSSSQVCQNDENGIGKCLSYTDYAVSDCICGGGGSYIDDYYETTGNRYLQCVEGCAPTPRMCPVGLKFDFLTEKCSTTAATVPTTCSQVGYFLLGCREGYLCNPGETPRPIHCGATEFFNPSPNGAGCTAEANVKIAPFSCPQGASGAFPDTLECSGYYICSSGSVQGGKGCCPPGQVFSPLTMICTTDTSLVTCPAKHPCDTSSYTYKCSSSTVTTSIVVNPAVTTPSATGSCVPPTCTTYGALPNPCNCQQYYWCAGGKATIQKCPTQLYFDSKQRLCVKAADFTGCT